MTTHQTAREKWQDRRADLFRSVFAPKPRISVSEWADRYRQLSQKNSAEPGRWKTSRVPYLREIMDAVSDPEVQEIVVLKSARVGYTEGVIGNALGYHLHQDPCPLLVVQPTDEDAEKWSKENLAPLLEETPVLRGRVAHSRIRDSGNSILFKQFRGGFIAGSGANSPRGLRRRTVRKVFFDEVDGMPLSAGDEGDPIGLAKKRAQTFWNRQYIYGSSPTIKGVSRMEKLHGLSDQRYYLVPCPHCQHRQRLVWGGPDEPRGLKWETRDIGDRKEVVAESVGYLCESCGALIGEEHKAEMVEAGEWVASNPGARVRGYHISALYSLFDGARWPVLVQEWIDAQSDHEQLKAFVNTILGELWEEKGEALTPDKLQARAETYPAEVPAAVGVLTASVDVQGDRLELLIRGWGAGEESWMIAHHRIYGDPDQSEVWDRLEALRTRAYTHEGGGTLRVAAMLVDSGYKKDAVYRYVRPRQAGGVYASKGAGPTQAPPLSRATRANRDGVKLFTVGGHALKDVLFPRLRQQKAGPGYMHFRSADQEWHNGADAEYYAQFGAEKLMVRKSGGKTIREYKQVRDRNEAIDLEVYALAALHSLGMGVRGQLGAYAAKLQEEGARLRAERATAEAHRTPSPARLPRRGGFVNSWRG